MQISINNILISERVKESLEKDELKREIYNTLYSTSSFEAKIYAEEELQRDKFMGFRRVWFITQVDNKYIKFCANVTFNNYRNEADLYITVFLVLYTKIDNGIDILVKREQGDMMNFVTFMKEVEENKNFILKFNDNTDILSAIRMYEKITLEQDRDSETFLNINEMTALSTYRVDYSSVKDLNIDLIKMNKDTFVSEEFIDALPTDSYNHSRRYTLLKTKSISLPKNIKKSLVSIMKDDGNLYSSNESDDRDPKESVKLVDFSVMKETKGKGVVSLVIDIEDIDLIKEDYFIIFDRLRHRKRTTMLYVVKDIENNRINNNNLFQVLFNDGNFNEIGQLEDWNVDHSLKEYYSKDLFERQKIAFDLSTDNFPITFIQGPPGTGKTHTITQICKYYNHIGKKVLVSSQTNVAVENILENLWEDLEFNDIAIKADYKKGKYSEATTIDLVTEKINRILRLKESIDLTNTTVHGQGYKSNIVGSTTTSSALLAKRWSDFRDNVDVVIIDEISKSTVPELIRYVVMGKKIIFVGDQRQLAPMDEIDNYDDIWEEFSDKDKRIINKYINVSIFDKLFAFMLSKGRAVTLNINNRSLAPIANMYEKFYDESLNPQRKIEDSKIQWDKNSKPLYPFTFIGMNGAREVKINGGSRYNILEAEYINTLLDKLSKEVKNKSEVSIAIITFYGEQVRKIKKHVQIEKYRNEFSSIKVNTVDAFQGDQADIVIISTVREDKTLGIGFVNDYRRTNVAISRARDLSIVLGNEFLLRNIEMKINDKGKYIYDEIFNDLDSINDERFDKPKQFKAVG